MLRGTAGALRSGWLERELAVATARTPDLIRAALLALRQAAATGDGKTYRYRKASVSLSEIRPAGTEQGAMFDAEGGPHVQAPEWTEGQVKLMEAVDRLNGRFGRRAVVFGSMGPPALLQKTRDGSLEAPRWEMRRHHMSPRYTTRWDELPAVRA